MWAKYPLGLLADKAMRPTDTTARAFIKELAAAGVSFFVCNNSFTGFSVQIARTTLSPGEQLTREHVIAVHDELATHLLPNTMLVPAGVAAINALQEARFTYCD